MTSRDIRDQWALVTGGSSGLGVDFARELARRGAHLILVARREERLEEVAAELRQDHGVEVDVLALDLGEREAPAELHRRVEESGRAVDILVNNAGFGIHGPYLEMEWERERGMLDLDIVTLADLTRRFARDMVARGRGRILQVASIAAYQAVPTYASYGAAKSFVLHFGEAIHHELRGTGVTCTVVSPGVTATEFLQVAGQPATLYQRIFMMQSARVAQVGIRALLAGRRSIVPGFLNTMVAFSVRLMPRRMAAAIAAWTMRE